MCDYNLTLMNDLFEQVVLPTTELVLAPRDDTAEFDENMDAARDYADDPKFVYLI